MAKYEIEGKRILEVGCGIALASHVLNFRNADITATDYHPEVERFLDENTELNNASKIPFIRTDWVDPPSDLGLFDLIIGSDLLYESVHAEQLSIFIDQQSKKTGCEVIIIDPDRPHKNKFKNKMIEFGFNHRAEQPEAGEYLPLNYKGKIHFFNR